MSEIEGIKDFIEANKSSLENMNQEMIASRGCKPLIWLTVEEAKAIHEMLYNYVWEYAFCLTDYDVKLPDDLLSRIKQVDDEFNGEYLRFYEERIEQAEDK